MAQGPLRLALRPPNPPAEDTACRSEGQGQAAGCQIPSEAPREMLEAPLCCVSLERAPRNDEERVLKVVAWQSAVDVLAASAEHEPIQQLRHFCVAASVNTCGTDI